jgi:hypothetical protein
MCGVLPAMLFPSPLAGIQACLNSLKQELPLIDGNCNRYYKMIKMIILSILGLIFLFF